MIGPVPVNSSFSLLAYALNSEGAYEDVTSKTVWSTSDASVIRQSSNPVISFASFAGVGVGRATITAEYAGFSHSVTFETYRSDQPAYPMLTIRGNVLAMGTSSSARATLQRTASDVYDVTTLAEWTSSDPAVATVTFGGVISARTPGTVLITASYLGISGSSLMSVMPRR